MAVAVAAGGSRADQEKIRVIILTLKAVGALWRAAVIRFEKKTPRCLSGKRLRRGRYRSKEASRVPMWSLIAKLWQEGTPTSCWRLVCP